MAGTAISRIFELDGHGGKLQVWTCSIDPASIAAAAQGIETVAIPGARASDIVFVNANAAEANVLVGGAKVTADDVVSVYLNNNITVTTALDGGAIVYFLLIIKRAGGDTAAA